MATEDEEKTNQDENEPFNEMNIEGTPEFLLALNRFVLDVAKMDWPEEFPLSSDRKFCFSVFQRYWRLQRRHQRESERGNGEFHMRFEGGNKEEIRRFMQHRFGRMFDQGEPSLNIDPEQHDPGEEHVDERAKERQKRFQNEWE